MQIFRKKIDLETFRELSTRDVARCCGVSERTARSWRDNGPPPTAARLLALASGDMESIAGPDWRYWRVSCRGLVSPDGQHWTPGALGAWWIERQQIPTMRAALDRYRDGVPIIDRRELDRLQRAADAAQRAAAELSGIYPHTHENADAEPAYRSLQATG
tara:strand:- start:904 stop:1383 length:480 start_codon:yes stop_codon:yes gene_type:complete